MNKRLSKTQRWLLMEAARRYLRFRKDKSETLIQAWTGCGSITTYKPAYNAGYMITHDGAI